MKKQYYLWYGDFGNVYNLYWAETAEQIKLAKESGYTRITRRQAEKLCAEENNRRNYDDNFSGYADNLIWPIDYEGEHAEWDLYNRRNVFQDGYVVEYKENYKMKRLRSFHAGEVITNKRYGKIALPEASDLIVIKSEYDATNNCYEYRNTKIGSNGLTELPTGGYISVEKLATISLFE